MDLAITEAGYAIVRILQRFPALRLPHNAKVEALGTESQDMVLVILPKDGCRVQVDGLGQGDAISQTSTR